MFTAAGEESVFNQLGETRIQGGQSRGNALKSMVFYANKRFDPDHKRYSYEFFPDQKPGVTEFKSFSLRDGGNDFGDLYFRDLIVQRTMASHVDLTSASVPTKTISTVTTTVLRMLTRLSLLTKKILTTMTCSLRS